VTLRLGAVLTSILTALALTPALPAPAYATPRHPAVVHRAVIGHSVEHRPILAYRLGERGPGIPTVLIVSTMHGNERQIQQIPEALRDGPRIHGVDLWVVPVMNPDGLRADTRQNAHGVDLNRNFPTHWVHTTGHYGSGPRPASEPETRAMMRFVKRIRPDRVISFHQPLTGVDLDSRRPGFSRRVSRALHLPVSHVTCGGVCGGTMTQWFEARFPGTAITVEYPAHPSSHTLRVQAPQALLRLFGGGR
jgi:murein peptide amidase A